MTSARRWTFARWLLAAGFIVAGLLHFVRPRAYESIVPPWLPNAEALVAISGVAEVLGGVGLLVPQTRRAASYGLIALLAAVFPANVQMAIDPSGAGAGLPLWALVGRLPIQPALGWLVWRAGDHPDRRTAPARPPVRRESPR